MADWKAFVEAVRKEPKNFAKAVVDCLNPPNYVRAMMKEFDWLCHFCWKPRTDICCWCGRSVCEEHCEMILGPKTKLEWYVCSDDLKAHSRSEIMKRIEEDEQFFREDQEEKVKLKPEEAES